SRNGECTVRWHGYVDMQLGDHVAQRHLFLRPGNSALQFADPGGRDDVQHNVYQRRHLRLPLHHPPGDGRHGQGAALSSKRGSREQGAGAGSGKRVLADPLPIAVLTSMATKRVITLVAGVSAWACNGDGTQPAGPPFDLLKSGGDAQNWYFNNPLPTPLSVTAVDVSGQPVPGVVVTWGVTFGGVSPVQSTTNANGVATTTDTLGTSTVQTVSASFTGLSNAARFTEVGTAPSTGAGVSVGSHLA